MNPEDETQELAVEEMLSEEQPAEEEQPIQAVTAVTVIMALDGQVIVVPTEGIRCIRQPSNADLRMLALYLHDQIIANPPQPSPQEEEQSLRDRLAQLLEDRRSTNG